MAGNKLYCDRLIKKNECNASELVTPLSFLIYTYIQITS